MKRILVLALALALLLTIPVLAADDLSGMTLNQLLTLRTDIEAELLNRGEKKSFTVPAGVYEVGLDFPEGTYAISLGSGFLATLLIGTSESALEAYDVIAMHAVSQESIIGKLKLEKGRFVSVSSAPLVFSIYTGIKMN